MSFIHNDDIIPHIDEVPFPAYEGPEPYAFVSYAHLDYKVVFEEIKRFKKQGLNIWYDEGVAPGNEWLTEIGEALKDAKLFIVFISNNSVNSKYVKKEINYVLRKDIPFIAIHIEETELPVELDLAISDLQAILKYGMSEKEYYRRYTKAFNRKLKKYGIILKTVDSIQEEYSKNETSINPPFEPYEGNDPYVFVSFRPKDQKLVYPVIKKLHEAGVNIWYDAYPSTTNTKRQGLNIIRHIKKSSLFITFITEEAVKCSKIDGDNFNEELDIAYESEIKSIPIFLEDVELDYSYFELIFNNKSLLKYEFGDNEDLFIKTCISAFKSLGFEQNELLDYTQEKDYKTEPYIYVSYARRDADRVLPTIERLRNAGYNVYHKVDVQIEKKWQNEMELILNSSLVVMFISKFYWPEMIDEDTFLPRSLGIPIIPIYLEETYFKDSSFINVYFNNQPPILKYEYFESEDMFIEACISAFKNHGIEPNELEVKDNRHSSEKKSFILKKDFEKIFDEYLHQRVEYATTRAPIANFIKNNLKSDFINLIDGEFDGTEVNATAGTGNLALCPHLSFKCDLGCILRFNFVFIFKADMSGVYFSMIYSGGRESDEYLKKLKNSYQYLIKVDFPHFEFLESIDLGEDTAYIRNFEKLAIISKFYSKGNIPSDDVLIKDMKKFIECGKYICEISR